MAKLSDRTELVTPADGDLYVTTDVSDTSDAATGTDKKITWANLKAGFKTYFDTLYAGVLGADDNYVTDAEKTKLSNLSGTNTGDQTITNSSDATSHTVTLSASGGSVQFVEGSNVTLTTTGTGSAGVVTIAASGGAPEGTAVLSTGEVGAVKFLREDGDGTCSWQVPAGAGNVTKVGTPADNQVGVWTGDGTIEGDAGFTFDGGLGITVADAENKVGLTVTQNDTTNSQTGIKIISAVVPSAQTSYPLIVENTNTGANGAFIQTYHNSSSPAANDYIGGWDMYGKDSAGNPTQYANINAIVTDPTNGSEDSQLVFSVTTASTIAETLYIRGSALYPATNDAVALGISTNQFSDLFLAEGGVINWDNGDVTMTQTGNVLAVSGGDLQVATAGVGTNADSVPTISSTSTLTNKRVTPRVGTTTSSATPTINTDNYDYYSLTAQTVDITSFTTNLSGTPTDGQKLWISITGTAARAITWGTSFEASTIALPTTTVTTNRLDVGFVWNAATSKWRCVASA